MAAQEQVTLVIRARDRTGTVLRRVRRAVADIGAGLVRLTGAAAAGIGALGGFLVKGAFDLRNASELINVSAEDLQAVARIAQRRGLGFEQVVDGLAELSNRAQEAQVTTGAAADAFDRLGIFGDVLNADPITLLIAIEDAAKKAGIESDQLRQILDELGGDVLREFEPLLGGRFGAEVRQIADSDQVRSNEEVAATAKALEVSQEQMSIAMVRLAQIMEREIPRLVDVLERSIAAYEGETGAEGLIPGGLGATVSGTRELAQRRVQELIDNALTFQGSFLRAPVIPGTANDPEVIATLKRIADNTDSPGLE